jgi:heptosyltransferase-2
MSALVVSTGGGIGDVLLATPVMRALGRRYGEVVAITTPQHRAVLEHDPDLAEVWTTSGSLRDDAARARARGFAAAVVTWASPRAAALPYLAGVPQRVGQARRLYSPLFNHRIVVRSELGDRTTHWTQILLDFARALDCDELDATPRFVVDEPSRASVAASLAAAGVRGPYLVLHPTRGISAARERWPTERLAELARALQARDGFPVVVTGSPADRAIADEIASGGGSVPFGGRTSIGEFAALAADARAVVAMDSGPMHVAAAVGAPTLGIFALASDEPDRWAPLGRRTAVVRATYPCPPSHRKETCPNFACVAALDIAGVLRALDALLEGDVRAKESFGTPSASN